MNLRSCLLFELQDSLYGMDTLWVEEVFFLPELVKVAGVPPEVAGVLNLRSQTLLVLDLSYRLGIPQDSYRLSDSVIVLQHNYQRIGIIVQQVRDVISIAEDQIDHNWNFQNNSSINPALLTAETAQNSTFLGITHLHQETILLLNPEPLFLTTPLNPKTLNLNHDLPETSERHDKFKQASPLEQEIFRQRAQNLSHRLDNDDFSSSISMAIIGLNGETFGVELGEIREFTDIDRVTPIPCCPPHIVGNLNLRGEIVTLIDVRSFLNLGSGQAKTKAMVVQHEDLVVAIAVDEVFDVTYISKPQIQPIPTAIANLSEDALKGTVILENPLAEMNQTRKISILNLPAILRQDNLVVNEEI